MIPFDDRVIPLKRLFLHGSLKNAMFANNEPFAKGLKTSLDHHSESILGYRSTMSHSAGAWKIAKFSPIITQVRY